MTNDPTYDEQLALLKKHGLLQAEQRHAAARQRQGDGPIPARRLLLRDAARSRRTSARPWRRVLAIARNVSVPFGAPYKGFGIYNTEYRTVIESHRQALLLRADDQPECGVGGPREVQPHAGLAGDDPQSRQHRAIG